MAVTRLSFASSLLTALNCPVNAANLRIVVGWEVAEGGAGPQFGVSGNTADYNPMNTKLQLLGSRDSGGGIQAYLSWKQGLDATAQTISQPNMSAILSMLQTGTASPQTAVQVITGSQWGTTSPPLTAALIQAQSTTSDGGQPIAGNLFAPGTSNKVSASLWIVGSEQNPDEDYWSCINRYAMSAQLYAFSDGEALYVADGIQLMGQTPADVITLMDPRVIEAHLTYDNCLSLDTPIPTPDGWTTMADVQTGDLVLGSDRRPTRVLGVSEVHRDHDCYRVEFSDGTSVVADDGHLWATNTGIRTTAEIRGTLTARVELAERVREPRTVRAVTPVPSVPVKCIAVDAPDHLYLVGDGMIPTHNTSFQGTHDAVVSRDGQTVRRAALARTTSPTECELKIICDIDAYRGGDVVILQGFGQAADGLWLLGECRRSVFDPFSTLTLVQGMAPLSAQTGTSLGVGYLAGAAAVAKGAGTVINAMVSQAASINNQHLPYEFGGGHAHAGTPDAGRVGGNHVGGFGVPGFDCSGAVAAVLAAGGLWQGSVPASTGIVDALLAKQYVLPGAGHGVPECTLYDSPHHIFMRLNGEFFGTEDGTGHIPTGSSGGGWIPNGSAGTGWRVTHVPPTILGQRPSALAGIP